MDRFSGARLWEAVVGIVVLVVAGVVVLRPVLEDRPEARGLVEVLAAGCVALVVWLVALVLPAALRSRRPEHGLPVVTTELRREAADDRRLDGAGPARTLDGAAAPEVVTVPAALRTPRVAAIRLPAAPAGLPAAPAGLPAVPAGLPVPRAGLPLPPPLPVPPATPGRPAPPPRFTA
ncbi:hypothetical protein [Cellulomonas endophytica]|uniref:hypothetical protein n=1 Tax=Cellulomonas endophytica TaxID=2494735 RepID=UPI0010119934|nr:hypothetical protein [Cellulomonas endophytica]